ncbi:MAG: DUF3108 domain-containing protein [Alphaproteobacteria bacterium]|nr:DUF3108 domain-containing protein [Alphaproteobacteria bacterium]
MGSVRLALVFVLLVSAPVRGLNAQQAANEPAGEFWLTYSVFAIGLTVAQADIIFNLADGTYNGLLDIQTVGLANTLASWSFRAESAGRREAGALVPNEHITRIVRRDRARQIEIFFEPGGPERIVADPPIRPRADRTPLTDDMLPGTIDLVTAILSMFQVNGEAAPCLAPMPVFDGRHRFDLVMEPIASRRFAGRFFFSGLARGCRIRVEPIGGFKSGDDNFNFNRSYQTWFADVTGTGAQAIVFMEADFKFGHATIALTQVRNFEGQPLR